MEVLPSRSSVSWRYCPHTPTATRAALVTRQAIRRPLPSSDPVCRVPTTSWARVVSCEWTGTTSACPLKRDG